MPGKRSLRQGGVSAKRARVNRAKSLIAPRKEYARLKDVPFPPSVAALGHVLQLVDKFLMPPEEAVMEAAAVGDTGEIRRLALKFPHCKAQRALVVAATYNHVASAKALLSRFFYDHGEIVDQGGTRSVLVDAVKAAGSNGRLAVFKLLLNECFNAMIPWQSSHLAWATAARAFSEAAGRGHLNVVRYLLQFADGKGRGGRIDGYNALAQAISGGHKRVVHVLMQRAGSPRELEKAFVAAVKMNQPKLAEEIYKKYDEMATDEPLIISLAHSGEVDAVKYLYEHGRDDVKLISKAFVRVAKRRTDSDDMLIFLFETGHVSSDAFDKALVAAASASWGSERTVKYLCGKQQASTQAMNSAFTATVDASVTGVLLENGEVSDEAIITAFKNAAGCATTSHSSYYSHSKEKTKMFELLYKTNSIPTKVFGEAYVVAAKAGRYKLVQLMRDDNRLSPDMMNEAFAVAAANGSTELMELLYDEQISHEAIFTAFTTAASQDHLNVVGDIVKIFSVKATFEQDLHQRAFTSAAANGQLEVLEILCESKTSEWAFEVLKEALDAAKNGSVRNCIRRTFCNQLFNPSRSRRLGAVMELLGRFSD
ncbi:unnamed protein product [Phytophthora lilii]|uniref:Unnamed protein product n=1 Tax=Phytophthora lilii TaxID=2077276 RepID=A0A9W7CNP1_9STRA|nr:unnamed protein product [Phytophthora lilii]